MVKNLSHCHFYPPRASYKEPTIFTSKVLLWGRSRGIKKIGDMNKSVVRPCGSCSVVMLIVSWCRLMKAFEKSGIYICCVAVTNCLENCLFHVKFRGDDIRDEASY